MAHKVDKYRKINVCIMVCKSFKYLFTLSSHINEWSLFVDLAAAAQTEMVEWTLVFLTVWTGDYPGLEIGATK